MGRYFDLLLQTKIMYNIQGRGTEVRRFAKVGIKITCYKRPIARIYRFVFLLLSTVGAVYCSMTIVHFIYLSEKQYTRNLEWNMQCLC